MPTINPNPTVTNLSLPLNGGIGPLTATVTVWEMAAVVVVGAQSITVPSGRYLATLMVVGSGDHAPPGQTWQADTGASATTISVPAKTLRHLRGFSADRTVQVILDVQRWDGAHFIPWASTGVANGIVTVPPAAVPSSSTLPMIGASCGHVAGSLAALTDTPEVLLDAGLQAIHDMGGNLCRDDPQWMMLCPSSTSFDATEQAVIDAYMTSVAAKGLKAIVFLEPIITSPAWAATSGTRGNMPASWSNFTSYVSAFLTRWGANVAAVELINEPNLNTYPNGGSGPMPVADYVTCLSHLYTAVKAYSSTMPVLAGCVAMTDQTWLTSLYANGSFKGNYDGISVHPYCTAISSFAAALSTWKAADPAIAQPESLIFGGLVESVSVMHEIMRANSDGTIPIWVTETGWQTNHINGPGGVNASYDCSEAAQGKYLAYTVRALSRLPYVAGICLYSAIDDSIAAAGGGGYGLVDAIGHRQKPAVAALATAIAGLKAGTG